MEFRKLRGLTSGLLIAGELLFLSAVVLATRAANYHDVFLGGEIYFTDADCYSRMTRARLCFEKPGTIVREQTFENFPEGTTPHTTSLFDYLIVALAETLRPLTARALDLAGALLSPLLGLIGAWFLWWWTRRFRWPERSAALLLYAASPILVHGTELGRPDHQSLLIFLMTLALCAECEMERAPTKFWAAISGASWGLALWTSFYEPLILLLVLLASAVLLRRALLTNCRKIEWAILLALLLFSFAIERRLPLLPLFRSGSIEGNWLGTIGELARVSFRDPVWWSWTGLFLIALPILFCVALRQRPAPPAFLAVLLLATYFLTIWQARWAYFFVLLLAISIPFLLAAVRQRGLASLLVLICSVPILQAWDRQLWPNESEAARRLEERREKVGLRAAAATLRADRPAGFLAPWWLSPSLAYWSGQPGVAGSSHESLGGIIESARFFSAADPNSARAILQKRGVEFVVVYDSDRVFANSAAILGIAPPENALGRQLDRAPSSAPAFLQLIFQNGVCKIFQVNK